MPWNSQHKSFSIGILAPEIISVTEVSHVTSVQVTWNQPVGGLTIDNYVISYLQHHQSDNETGGNS